jgi:hypothetical protein
LHSGEQQASIRRASLYPASTSYHNHLMPCPNHRSSSQGPDPCPSSRPARAALCRAHSDRSGPGRSPALTPHKTPTAERANAGWKPELWKPLSRTPAESPASAPLSQPPRRRARLEPRVSNSVGNRKRASRNWWPKPCANTSERPSGWSRAAVRRNLSISGR